MEIDREIWYGSGEVAEWNDPSLLIRVKNYIIIEYTTTIQKNISKQHRQVDKETEQHDNEYIDLGENPPSHYRQNINGWLLQQEN